MSGSGSCALKDVEVDKNSSQEKSYQEELQLNLDEV